jgi:hypothetical protein
MPNIKLREYESILDNHYKTFSIIHEPIDESLFPLLFAFDSMFIVMMEIAEKGNVGYGTYMALKDLDEGFQIAIKYLTDKKSPTTIRTDRTQQLINNAGEFLLFAENYHILCNFHRMYNENMLISEIDPDKHIIQFKPILNSDRRPWHGFFQEMGSFLKINSSHLYLEKALNDLTNIKTMYINGSIVIQDVNELKTESLIKLTEGNNLKELLPIDKQENLDGFIGEEYYKFSLAIKLWSISLLYLYFIHYKNGEEQCQCMPTQLLSYNNFCYNMKLLTGISENSIHNIIKRLTFDFSKPKRDIFLQPFIKVDEQICGRGLYSTFRAFLI